MADRITRPDVALLGGNPDGNLSNLDEIPGLLDRSAVPDAYGLFYMSRKELKHDDDNDGAEIAKMKIRALEVLTDGVFPFDVHKGEAVVEVLDRLRQDRTGVATLPTPTSAEAAEHDRVVGLLSDWRAANTSGARDMTGQWQSYFGKDAPPWRDASTQQVKEFLAYKGEQIDRPKEQS